MIDYERLAWAIDNGAAVRRRQILQPTGGKGDKIFPPTYPEERRGAGPRHVFERRRIDEAEVWCVLIDSVQSQANRLEEALMAAVREGLSRYPMFSLTSAAESSRASPRSPRSMRRIGSMTRSCETAC